jgi:NAD(P)-dependent dehydrogenase (short-subunit alcohol dehydrogenase family)
MQDLEGRVAVVTGGASGIGLALAKRWIAEGMRVVIADLRQDALDAAVRELEAAGGEVLGVPTDVSQGDEVEALAARALEAFGAVHLVCNNAGVGGEHGTAWEQSRAGWDWVLGVNLWGVIHGVRTFLPILLSQGEPGHIVNTASIAGLRAMPYTAGYSASKYAVVGLSESLDQELREQGAPIGVSVLCPGTVRTGILDPDRDRPEGVAIPEADAAEAAAEQKEATRQLLARIGVEPEAVAERVADAVLENRFWIFTHAGAVDWVRDRTERLLALERPEIAGIDGLPKP